MQENESQGKQPTPAPTETTDFERAALTLAHMPKEWKLLFLLMLHFDLDETGDSPLNDGGQVAKARIKHRMIPARYANPQPVSTPWPGDETDEEFEEILEDYFGKKKS